MTPLLNAKQIREWDQYTITHEPIRSVDLMERAAMAFTNALLRLWPATEQKVVAVFCGPGNNGGDGLAISRLLIELGIQVNVYLLNDGSKRSEDHRINLQRFHEISHTQLTELANEKDFAQIKPATVIIDALYGSGLNRPVGGLAGALIQQMNNCNALKISVDIPSGLPAYVDEEFDETSSVIFKADHTFTFQQLKQSFLFAEMYAFTGEVEVLPIGLDPAFAKLAESPYQLLDVAWAHTVTKPRGRFSHKGSFGHALVIAGSYGKMGAALLASRAALRAGCGLLTAFVPKVGYTIFQTALPEAMVLTDDELYEMRNLPLTDRFDAVAVGPGLGTHPYTVKAVISWMQRMNKPVVIDADALNAIASVLRSGQVFSFPEDAIISPHPKEFDRLFGTSANGRARLKKQIEMAKQHKIIVVLKGAYTSVALPNGTLCFNTTAMCCWLPEAVAMY